MHATEQSSFGIMRRSNSLHVICLPNLFDLYQHTRTVPIGIWRWFKDEQSLTGCLDNIMCSANGPSTPGLQQPLAMTRLPMLPSTCPSAWAGSNRKQNFGAQYRSRLGSHPSPFVLATFLCTFQPATSWQGHLYASCNTRYWARG